RGARAQGLPQSGRDPRGSPRAGRLARGHALGHSVEAGPVGGRGGQGMRTIGPWTLALLALATPGWAADIYRWTDGAGNVHYSNMDAEGDQAAKLREEVTARLGATPPWWIDLR